MSNVTVGCKLPNGLILELGARGSTNYASVTLRGANDAHVVGGYGITEVDADFMSKWMKKHAWLPAVKQGHVFVNEGDRSEATAQAIDTATNFTGLERLDPKAVPKGIIVDADHMAQVARETPPAARVMA